MKHDVNREIEQMREALIDLRRDFHRYPELGWTEMRTSSIIARKLFDLGFDEVLTGDNVVRADDRMGVPSEKYLEDCYARAEKEEGSDLEFLPRTRGGMTGVIGILRCGKGPTVALRFDIDALPIKETDSKEHFPNKEDFASRHDGIMHACGHDCHMTIGLGTAEILAAHRKDLHGTLKLIFQPAEEGVRGAQAIVKAHHLDDVDYLLGAHMAGDSSTRKCAIGVGEWRSLATTKLDADIRGKAAHAGKCPDEGNNAMLAAATAVLNLQAVPRVGGAMTRINVGRLVAGTGRNVICDHAHLELEVRGSTSKANDYMDQYARRILVTAAVMHGCEGEIRVVGKTCAGKNDPDFTEKIRAALEANPDLTVEPISKNRSLVSEDYAALAEAVTSHGGKSSYMLNIVPTAASLHECNFSPEEEGLMSGVKAFATAVFALMK